MSSIEDITKNLQEANDKIKKLEGKIEKLEEKLEKLEEDKVTKTNDLEFWKTEKSQLQTDKNQLQAEKLLLLKERERLSEIADGLNQTLDPNNNFHYKGKENEELVMKKFDKLKMYLARHYNCAITILNRNLLCTFAHTVHSHWKVGDSISGVELFDKSSISCHIVKIEEQMDCIWLRPTKDLPEQIKQLDIVMPYLGQELVSIGLSGNFETTASNQDNHNFKNVSFDISNVCCYSVDQNFHSKTNKKSRRGDSGGPIFDYYSGLFVGMMVGSEHDTSFPGKFVGKGCFLPSVILHNCS